MNTRQVSERNLERWTSHMHTVCGQFETHVAPNHSLFIGEIDTRSHSGLSFTHLRTNAGLISRKSLGVDKMKDERCFLISQRSGTCHISQYGVNVCLAPGELFLMDAIGACDIRPMGLIEHASLPLPRSEVEHAIKGDAFGKVSLHKASGKVLHMLVEQLCRSETGLPSSQDEGEALEHALISLLNPSLEHSDGPQPLPSLSGNQLLDHVQQLIDESLSQPGLTPTRLANRLNISVRHLYRLFEEQGDSVCRYIQRSRLRYSARDLANPSLRSESITSIAYKWGFTDSAHFSRSFKKHFEQSPKDYRACMLQASPVPSSLLG